MGDEITTIGGITGTICAVKENTIVIETGADRVRIEFTKWAVSTKNGQSTQAPAERLTKHKADPPRIGFHQEERGEGFFMAGKREKKREEPMAVWLSTMCALKAVLWAAATAALGLLACACWCPAAWGGGADGPGGAGRLRAGQPDRRPAGGRRRRGAHPLAWGLGG